MLETVFRCESRFIEEISPSGLEYSLEQLFQPFGDITPPWLATKSIRKQWQAVSAGGAWLFRRLIIAGHVDLYGGHLETGSILLSII